MSDILFRCPKCGEEITRDSFKDHNSNWTVIENYLVELKQKQENEIRIQLKNELIAQMNDKQIAEINLVKQEMLNNFNKQLEVLNISINEKDNLINKLNEQKTLEIDKERNAVINEFNEKIQTYELNIQKQQNIIDQLNQQKIAELNEAKSNLLNEFNNVKNSLEIKLANKEVQIKALDEKLNLEIEKNKEVLINQFSQEINNLKLELNNKRIELENLVIQKEAESKTKELTLINDYDKRIADLVQANREFKIINSKRKGENFEHEVYEDLVKAFSLFDGIEKITTGEKKADYLQTIKNHKRQEIGKIVYEVKNAEWSNTWIPKLSTDAASNNTKYGILIATSFNDKYPGLPFVRSDEYENIWITDSESFIFVGQIVRRLVEFENEYNQKIKTVTNSSDNQLFKELEKQKAELNEYWTIQFPTAYKKMQKELEDLDKVADSLERNSSRIKKSINVINQQFFNKVQKGLSSILGEMKAQDK
ncbi:MULTISPECIES: DUF2130 domain-containing protein [Mesoplasma]|uniref:DUF2130 domain-containing protein n=1 Tax=Mesoplasma florum TaxID=2151 RepID=A0A2R3P7L8_MESFO|nr:MULTISPECIES: DUF2130 domain-containing protein [Mesoplasma]AVN64483.1 DUF2130 domain-containing protein [Mesoplasma florum]